MQMTATILDGKAMAARMRQRVQDRLRGLSEHGTPKLAIALVGDNDASHIYVRHKLRAAEEVGIEAELHTFPADIGQKDLDGSLRQLNRDANVDGVLLQMPLPEGLDPETSLLQIEPGKDVDGLHPFNLGMIVAGHPYMIPCTPYGIMSLLEAYEVPLRGQRALVLGRSRLVGKPIAQLLTNASATVTTAHSRTRPEDLALLLASSDLVVSAIGKPGFLDGSQLRQGATVIDVGINRGAEGKLVGDVDFESALTVAGAITPVPGGVGPLTVAHLLLNVVKAFEVRCFGCSSIGS
jgi:methylenetetrahydrofolate dehydrogenase (NADP+)/methenyltetrahydrofolate cyclohydrolase